MNENISHLKTLAAFMAAVLSVVVSAISGKVAAGVKLIGLLPKLPGVIAALPHVREEWAAMGDGDAWREIVATFDNEFDIPQDDLELFIEGLIDDGIELLSRLVRTWERVSTYLKATPPAQA